MHVLITRVLLIQNTQLRGVEDGYITNRMWFSVVWTLIDNGTRHHSGQNVVDSRGAFDHCDDENRCR